MSRLINTVTLYTVLVMVKDSITRLQIPFLLIFRWRREHHPPPRRRRIWQPCRHPTPHQVRGQQGRLELRGKDAKVRMIGLLKKSSLSLHCWAKFIVSHFILQFNFHNNPSNINILFQLSGISPSPPPPWTPSRARSARSQTRRNSTSTRPFPR